MRLILTVCAALLTIGPVAAQETQPWGSRDFSAKRVGALSSGSRPALVQIDPEEEPYYLTPAITEDGTITDASAPSRSSIETGAPAGWFWNGISPSLADGSPDRLANAIGQLSLAEKDLLPSWGSVARMVQEHSEDITAKSLGTRVSPALALAVMSVESAGKSDAVSTAGATGLMQLMPATAARFDVTDRTDPTQSIAGGVAYLEFLLRTFGNDPILALAAYNAGEGAVARHGGVPPFKETRNYVPKVLAAWTVARLFCTVPPEKATDPCAFAKAKEPSG